jgi:CRP-like cAMP-binding protein
MNRKFYSEDLRPRLVPKQASMGYPGFAPVVSDALEHLKDLAPAVRFEAGQTILEQGSEVKSVWLIRSGLVKLKYGSQTGRDCTLGLRSAGWCAGGVWVHMNRPSVYAVTAVTAGTASCIPASEFASRLLQSSKLMRHFLQNLCQEAMSHAISQAQIMSWSAEERLQQCVIERDTSDLNVKTLDILPLLTQGELAHLLSVTPEHLCRLMRKAANLAKEDQVVCDEKSA